ncbi:MAG: MBL fold metallo-hydrolase, partial [Clostridia bacterium]|nr:MBL fold metallo-hydrolase [Clostridia bacterium]
MRITFMGTSVIPRKGQASNSVFVETGNGDSFIFDMGSGVSTNYVAMGIPYSRMDKVFLTHLHADHMSDLT